MFAIAYYELNNINGNQDVAVKDSSPSYIPHIDTEFRTAANETQSFRVNVRVAPMGSWTRDFNDIMIFGWPELV